jgi:hypothetical protein
VRKVSLDPRLSRRAAICCRRKKLALLGENVLPHGDVGRIDHPIAAIQAACRFVESLSATACIRCPAHAEATRPVSLGPPTRRHPAGIASPTRDRD